MPTGFQIYTDPGVKPQLPREPTESDRRNEDKIDIPRKNKPKERDDKRTFILDDMMPKIRFAFDIWKHYPIEGGELSYEELRLKEWDRKQSELALKNRVQYLERENEIHKSKVESLTRKNEELIQQIRELQQQEQQNHQQRQQQPDDTVMMEECQQSPTLMHGGRLSIIPKSLQMAQDQGDHDIPDMSMSIHNPSVVDDLWAHTAANKFTLPIDQSAYIRQNIPTSTPNNKRQEPKQLNMVNRRRSSRAHMGGSPTLKLSPITETSRDGNSKSSSSSSSETPSTIKKARPEAIEAPLQLELNPNDPVSYMMLLANFCESLDKVPGFYRAPRGLPMMRNAASLQAGSDTYLIQKEIATGIYSAQLLPDDSNEEESSSMDFAIKRVCCRVDKPANEWLFYICTEFHNRLPRLKTKPDIELSIMMTNPAIIYSDASVVIDEYCRYITLQDFLDASQEAKRPFPKSIAAYVALELIQIVRQMHICDIVHLNVKPSSMLIMAAPSNDDLKNVREQTTMVKLIGFDRAIDLRLVPQDFKFEGHLGGFPCSDYFESQPWSHEADWIGVLNCINQMFFKQNLSINKSSDGRWTVNQQFKGLPTEIWTDLYDKLLNAKETSDVESMIESAIEELSTWINANANFVMKEMTTFDELVENKMEKSKRCLDETGA